MPPDNRLRTAALWAALNLVAANFFLEFLPPNIFRFFIGMWMPATTALIFAYFQPAPIRQTLNLHIGNARAYLWAAAYPTAVAAITVAIGLASGHLTRNPDPIIRWSSAIPTLIVWMLASLGEELGWRGYFHNQLRQLKHAPLIIGLVWASWHLQDLRAQHAGHFYMIPAFFVTVIFASYFLSWLVETSGSVLACGFFHGVWNFLRLKLLFGNPVHSTTGCFLTDVPRLTEMEGVYGCIAAGVVGAYFVHRWYRDKRA